MSEITTDGRVQRGDRTRRAILGKAVDVASVEGLEGLSIGRLATELSMSKSGLVGAFGSKEQLQLATIRAARAIFVQTVVEPALRAPVGVVRLRALIDAWLAYSSDRRFPGGCFFARVSHEYAGRPGAVRDALASIDQEWVGLIATTVAEAQQVGEIRAEEDADLLAFDLVAYLDSANLRSLLTGGFDVYDHARRAVDARLAAAEIVPAEPR
ncbi:TetR/AcrR family transcriptional regulator [Nocardioides sp. GY 10113]|uniref:TetR/AcrR family transcriptional regulator n=1 Tax=Nocardioides sp. GY 10113 TaxID=2569761 RepID=UPI0010A91F96|nr:TetR family transcriptional regulator C-terminal domain-containing protein [Nocardioides sp. GY 10113]TIC88257.1 TetR/AcrR family transcriptional regulator [Nocardioides sp. GY 10113]